jgi:hypothetical protein
MRFHVGTSGLFVDRYPLVRDRNTLETALTSGGDPERPPEVIDAFMEISIVDTRVVRCIELLLDKASAGRLARYKEQELRTIFQQAIKGDESTAEATRALINRLLSLAIDGFRDLL